MGYCKSCGCSRARQHASYKRYAHKRTLANEAALEAIEAESQVQRLRPPKTDDFNERLKALRAKRKG